MPQVSLLICNFLLVLIFLSHPKSISCKRKRIKSPQPLDRVQPLARIRRNHQRPPSSRCIESARTHRARADALPLRASDTTLRLPVTDRFESRGSDLDRSARASQIRRKFHCGLQSLNAKCSSIRANPNKPIVFAYGDIDDSTFPRRSLFCSDNSFKPNSPFLAL